MNHRAPAGFYFLLALLALCAGGKAILYDTLDPDCFWHLRVADQLRHDGIGPIVDHLSFASSPKPWTPYSWLAELGMKSVWDAGGYRLAVAVQAVMQAAFVVLLAGCCLESQGTPNYLAAILATAAGTFLTLAYLSFRPVTAVLVLLAACTWLIRRDRRLDERSTSVWLVVPLTALMTNIHLFAFFVPAALLAMTIGAASESQRRSVQRYAILTTATTTAFLCTPMLPGLLRTIFFYGSQDQMVRGPVIAEMQFFARGPMGVVAAIIVGGMLASAIRRYRDLRVGEWICLVCGTILLLSLGRFSPIFALAAAPALAATFPPLSDRALTRPAMVGLLCVILLAAVQQIVAAFPGGDKPLAQWLNRHGPGTPGYPCKAADFVEKSVACSSGHLINEFSWGGYLSWRLGGRYQVLLDGRTQVYPQQLWQATYLGSDFQMQQFLQCQTADAAVLPTGNSRFAPALAKLGWTTVFHDDRARVMVPPQAMARTE